MTKHCMGFTSKLGSDADDYGAKSEPAEKETDDNLLLYIVITALGTLLLCTLLRFLYKKCVYCCDSPGRSHDSERPLAPPYFIYRGGSHYNGFRDDVRSHDNGRPITDECFRPPIRFNHRTYLPPDYDSHSDVRRSYEDLAQNPACVNDSARCNRNGAQDGETSRFQLEPLQQLRIEAASLGERSTLPLRPHPFQHGRDTSVVNPVFNDDEIDTRSAMTIPSVHSNQPDDPCLGCLEDLNKVTERSLTQTVCGKLVVSITRKVDHRGDTLILDNMGISLRVPPGAVKEGETKLIVLVLNWDLSDNPYMLKTESLVSPVVYVGPHNLKLEKPCLLTFRHCAFDPRQIRVMKSETELVEQKHWEAVCESSEEGLAYLTADECQLTIDTFTLYTCVQTPIEHQIGKKWLQIAVFACPLRKERNHHQIRVYFLNKTNCALQWAIQNEAKYGGKLVCPEKVFLFDGNERDMFILTKYISPGWELLENEESERIERITFLNIWHGKCPHVSVCFRRSKCNQDNTSEQIVAIEMSLRLIAYQDELQESAEKIFIQVCEDNVTPVNENEIKCERRHMDDLHIHIHQHRTSNSDSAVGQKAQHQVLSRSSEGSNSVATVDRSVHVHVGDPSFPGSSDGVLSVADSVHKPLLSHDIKKKLILLLDPSRSPIGSDWRDFAGALGKDNMITYLQSTHSPTEKLLSIVETNNMELSELHTIFENIERKDCAMVIKECMSASNQNGDGIASSRPGSEHSYVENDRTFVKVSNQGESSWEDSSYRGNQYYNNSASSLGDMNTFGEAYSKMRSGSTQQSHYKPNILL